jgi:type IV pilus assembly protein PilA
MRLVRTLRRRASAEAGFTLVELLVVLVIIAVLIAIAVPSYLGFKDRAADRAAQANLRMGLAAAEAYYSDHASYVGMDGDDLRAIDRGLPNTLVVVSVAGTTYCIRATAEGRTWSVRGPGTATPGYVANGSCA